MYSACYTEIVKLVIVNLDVLLYENINICKCVEVKAGVDCGTFSSS